MEKLKINQLKSGKIDNSFIFLIIKKAILSQKFDERHIKILEKETVWKNFDQEKMLEWARLSEIALRADVAEKVLDYLNANYPENKEAWKENFNLLMMLGKKKKALQVRAKGIIHHPELEKELTLIDETGSGYEPDRDIEEPFYRERKKEELLNLYLNLFQGREECFAQQWVDKEDNRQGYFPVRRSITVKDIEDHITGKRTYGIYLLMSNSMVKVAVIDADLNLSVRKRKVSSKEKAEIKKEKDFMFERIKEKSQRFKVEPLIEFSGGKGYHFWYFMEEPVPAKKVREVFSPIVKELNQDLTYFNLELFPKQDKLEGKGFGNLVKLPLGIHRLTGKPSYFVNEKNKDPWVQIELLKRVKVIPSDELKTKPTTNIITHPRKSAWEKNFPELALLCERCPPLGHIIVMCKRSRDLSMREKKILFGTIGFLSRGKTLIHYLLQNLSDYNPYEVDFRLSKLRGSPIGCKKIHSLLEITIDFCEFEDFHTYPHPLLHCPQFMVKEVPVSEKVENLSQAIERLKQSIDIVLRFLPNQQNFRG